MIPLRYDVRSAYVYSRCVTWRVVLVWSTVACSAEVPPEAAAMPSNRVARVVAPPNLTELRSLLDARARDRFSPAAIAAHGCPGNLTVGQYVASLVANGTRGPDRHELTGGCGPFPEYPIPIDPPRDDAYWYCRIDSHAYGAEDPWHYELRVRVRKRDRVLDLATASCPGA